MLKLDSESSEPAKVDRALSSQIVYNPAISAGFLAESHNQI
jgi:hypothetical protein